MIAFIKKEIFIFLVMGCIYTNIELVLRGFTHPSMIILGGLCGMLIGLINNIAPNKNLYKQCFLSMLIVTFLEFIFGYILNIKLGLNIWDYSDLPLNINGQICLPFAILWFLLTILITYIDDFIRYKLFGEEKPEPFITYITDLFK